MRSPRFLCGLPALFVLFVGPPQIRAADVVRQIPDNALAYVVVKNLREANREVNQTARRMGLPAPNLLKMAEKRLGSLEGVVDNGDLALVLMGDEAGSPFPVFFVRTSDYGKLLSELNAEDEDGPIARVNVAGESMLIAEKGNYAVLTAPPFRDGLKQTVECEKSVKFDKQTQAFTQNVDAYAVATSTGVQLLAQQAIAGLQAVKQTLARLGPDGEAALAAFEMYEEAFKWAAEEVEQVGVTLQIDDNGSVFLAKRVDFQNAEEYSVAGSADGATKRLAQLPTLPYVFAGAGQIGNSKALEKWIALSMEMMQAMAEPRLTDDQIAELVEASRKSMAGVRGISFAFGVPEAGGSIYSRMVMVMEVDDANAFIHDYVQAMQQMQQIFAANQRMPYQILAAEKAQVAGVPGLKVVMQIAPAVLGASGEQVNEMFDKLYGKDGKIEVYAAPVDAKHVAIAYVSEENLRQVMQTARSPEKGLAADGGIRTTAKLLPEKAQLVGYLSPEGSVQFAQRMIQTLASLEQQAQISQIPPFPASPPLGFSFRYDGESLEAGLVAPAEFLTALGKYIQAVQQSAAR